MADMGELHATPLTFGKLMEVLMHDLSITDGAKVLYAHMHWRYGDNRRNFEGQKSMAMMLGVSETTISNRIKELEASDWIAVIERDFNPTSGAFQTPFYHIFERRQDCRTFRKTYHLPDGEALRDKPKKSRKRKPRKGVGGNPKLHQPNSSSDGDQPNSSSDGLPNLSSDGLPNSSSDYPDSSYPDSSYPDSKPIAPGGAAGASSSSENGNGQSQPDGPVFDKGRVFDCVAWAAWRIRDMRDLRKPLVVKGKEKENPAAVLIGQISNWIKKFYPELPEAEVAQKVVAFYKAWPSRRKYNIPRNLGKFTAEWLAWTQEGLPDPTTSAIESADTPSELPLR